MEVTTEMRTGEAKENYNAVTVLDRTPTGGQEYRDTLRTLSEASVRQHFQAFKDIDWDSPEYEVRLDDRRWILNDEDTLGAHEWYKSLPEEEQIRIGIRRAMTIAKVGLQFEKTLIAGVMSNTITDNNLPEESRYVMHEVTEETHHIQMFQEFVRRLEEALGEHEEPTKGASRIFREVIPPLAMLGGRVFPVAFYVGVLAGEEPIDHVQKKVMRSEDPVHPMFARIMQIHIAEEARHIGFAHLYIERHAPKLSLPGKLALTALYPTIMRVVGDAIMRPSKDEIEAMGVPKKVAKEVWWGAKESKKYQRDLFPEARMLADHIGIRGPLGRVAWKALGIDGRPARFRSEPARASD